MSNAAGRLYVVATPIGNLDDISPRARQILSTADWVAAEDTRHSGQLFKHLGISARLIAYHDHNEEQQSRVLVDKLLAGESVALVSDAGTPLISDPGYRIVAAAHQAGITVSPIPGASAMIAALSASGLPSDRFSFEGFLPSKSGQRQKRLAELAAESRTLIFYESSHRIAESLRDMSEVMGASRLACVARELTKTFETIRQGKLEELVSFVEGDDNQQKGEFVVMVAGHESSAAGGGQVGEDVLLKALAPHLPPKTAAKIAAELLGGKKQDYYQRLLEMKGE